MDDKDRELIEYFTRSFTNITPNNDQIREIEYLRTKYKDLMETILTVSVPDGRARSLALTHLETSLMYAVKGVLLDWID
jgi:hypothetical protein